MRVRMLTLAAGPFGVRNIGTEHDLPDPEAADYIDGGYALAVGGLDEDPEIAEHDALQRRLGRVEPEPEPDLTAEGEAEEEGEAETDLDPNIPSNPEPGTVDFPDPTGTLAEIPEAEPDVDEADPEPEGEAEPDVDEPATDPEPTRTTGQPRRVGGRT